MTLKWGVYRKTKNAANLILFIALFKANSGYSVANLLGWFLYHLSEMTAG